MEQDKAFRSTKKYRRREAKAAFKNQRVLQLVEAQQSSDPRFRDVRPRHISKLLGVNVKEVYRLKYHQPRPLTIVPLSRDPAVIEAVRQAVIHIGLRQLTVRKVMRQIASSSHLR